MSGNFYARFPFLGLTTLPPQNFDKCKAMPYIYQFFTGKFFISNVNPTMVCWGSFSLLPINLSFFFREIHIFSLTTSDAFPKKNTLFCRLPPLSEMSSPPNHHAHRRRLLLLRRQERDCQLKYSYPLLRIPSRRRRATMMSSSCRTCLLDHTPRRIFWNFLIMLLN